MPLVDLKNAIVKQAADDYAAAFMGYWIDHKRPADTMQECERFFTGQWYLALTNGKIDGRWLMRQIKINELEKVRDKYQDILSVSNKVQIKAVITYPKKLGTKQRTETYPFPPKLLEGIYDCMGEQLNEINKAIEELKHSEGQHDGTGISDAGKATGRSDQMQAERTGILEKSIK